MDTALRLARAVDRLNDRIGDLARWLVVVMVVVGSYNAVARYATRSFEVALSSNALNELQWYLFTLVFLLGAAYGLRRDIHVRVDVLYTRFGPRGRAWIDLLGTVLFLIPFSIVMLWVTWTPVRNSWRIREVSPDPGGLPRYPIKAVILLSFGLLVLQGLAVVSEQVAVLLGRVPPEAALGPQEPGEPDARHGEGL